jgi:tRNA threonylcarbamoyladenosine biosynthesis protein TsaB
MTGTLLAFDTATERAFVALAAAGRIREREIAGGARASALFLPGLLGLLEEEGIAISALDAIAFGRGPGAFTGLRVAASVAQGLALGAGKPVLPIDTLLAIAEDARADREALRTWVAIDARMDEIYAAEYVYAGGEWRTLMAPHLTSVEGLNARWLATPPEAVAGAALQAYAGRLQSGSAACFPDALPRARGLLAIAQARWARGEAVDAAEALPLYVRDRVAQTTAEREASKAAAAAPAGARA